MMYVNLCYELSGFGNFSKNVSHVSQDQKKNDYCEPLTMLFDIYELSFEIILSQNILVDRKIITILTYIDIEKKCEDNYLNSFGLKHLYSKQNFY